MGDGIPASNLLKRERKLGSTLTINVIMKCNNGKAV